MPSAMEKDLSTQEAMLSFNNHLYKAYALVDSWNEKDDISMIPAQNKLLIEQINTGKLARQLALTSISYADDKANDLAIFLSKGLIGGHEHVNKVLLLRKMPSLASSTSECLKTQLLHVLEDNLSLRLLGAQYEMQEDFGIRPRHDFCSFEEDDIVSYCDDFYLQQQLLHQQQLHQKVQAYRKKIIEFAHEDKQYGWKILVDENNNMLKVPGRAFLHFALAKSLNGHLDKEKLLAQLPPYVAFCERGLKLMFDDPLHSDAWLGAGLDLGQAYNHQSWEHQLFFSAAAQCQKEYLDYDFHLLSRGGKVVFDGQTCNPYNYQEVEKGQRVLVLPHLGIEFEHVALECDAIITEQGGALAHLVIVGREMHKGWPIVRVNNACLKFAQRMSITIGLLEGKINFNSSTTPLKKKKAIPSF